MTRRALFVDDEPNVLDGLRWTLRPLRTEWGMPFASSGPAALAAPAERPAGVLVTDTRVPGMDGLDCPFTAATERTRRALLARLPFGGPSGPIKALHK